MYYVTKQKLTLVMVCMFAACMLYGSAKPNYKFGKVNKFELEQKFHAADSSASAAYLYKSAKAYFDITPEMIYLVVDYHDRIKIYDEEGEDYADYVISLYRDGRYRERFNGLKAVTYNLEGGKVVETKLSKKDVYKEQVSDNRENHKFALPNVKAGSVIEVKYSFRTPYKYTIPTFYFQEYIPVDEAKYEIRIPSYYTYTPIAAGTVALSQSTREVNGDYGMDKAYTFTASAIPATKEDDYVLNTDDYRSALKYELYSDQFPNSTINYHSKNWNEIAKDLMEDKRFGKQLGKKLKDLDPVVASLEGKSDDQKILAIYEHVRTGYKWNGNYGYYPSHSNIKTLLKEKSGNIGDINQLLINLLNKAGIPTQPLLIRSRGGGLLNQSYPSVTELNYLLAYVDLGESYLLLDGTAPYTPIGNLPLRATNINGLLISGGTGQIIDLPNPNTYQSVTMITYDIDTETPSLHGSGKAMLKNYAGVRYRINHNKEDDSVEDNDDDVEEGDEEDEEEEIVLDNEYTINELSNIDDIYKDVKIAYDETIYNEIDMIGDQIFIDATLDFGLDENPFFQDTREYPVFYKYKSDNRYIVKINIPEDYQIESLPEAAVLSLPGSKASFKYSAKMVGGTLVLDYSFQVKSDFFTSMEYGGLKEMYRLLVEKSKEKVVLTKV